jgi:hypothetical protein
MTEEELLKDSNDQIKNYSIRLSHLRNKIDLIEESKREYKNSNNGKDLKIYKEMFSYINLNGYLVISLLDLYTNLKHLILSENEWEKIFFIKNSYLVIHETTKNLVLSKSQKVIEKSIEENFPSLSRDFRNISTKIKEFKNTEEYKKIEITRHHIAGHIIENIKTYYDNGKELTIENALTNIDYFFDIISDYINFINKYLEKAEDEKKL